MLSFFLTLACAFVALLALGVGGFFVLLKLGVIVRESSRPAYQDFSDYRLEQGREVRPEEDRQRQDSIAP